MTFENANASVCATNPSFLLAMKMKFAPYRNREGASVVLKRRNRCQKHSRLGYFRVNVTNPEK
jgi:hypothetical protein